MQKETPKTQFKEEKGKKEKKRERKKINQIVNAYRWSMLSNQTMQT